LKVTGVQHGGVAKDGKHHKETPDSNVEALQDVG
jgi:hypothetical protein